MFLIKKLYCICYFVKYRVIKIYAFYKNRCLPAEPGLKKRLRRFAPADFFSFLNLPTASTNYKTNLYFDNQHIKFTTVIALVQVESEHSKYLFPDAGFYSAGYFGKFRFYDSVKLL